MTLRFENGEPFAQGVTEYRDTAVKDASGRPRIVLQVEIKHKLLEICVDTGGFYLFCNSEDAQLLDLEHEPAIGADEISVRGIECSGYLYRLPVCLPADGGESMVVEMTVFAANEWTGPTLLGFQGCLERLRFAVDPSKNLFYFGHLAGMSP